MVSVMNPRACALPFVASAMNSNAAGDAWPHSGARSMNRLTATKDFVITILPTSEQDDDGHLVDVCLNIIVAVVVCTFVYVKVSMPAC
jgi:hypothetical protein